MDNIKQFAIKSTFSFTREKYNSDATKYREDGMVKHETITYSSDAIEPGMNFKNQLDTLNSLLKDGQKIDITLTRTYVWVLRADMTPAYIYRTYDYIKFETGRIKHLSGKVTEHEAYLIINAMINTLK